MEKQTIITLMLDKFPEMNQHINKLKWEQADNYWGFTANQVPQPLQSQIIVWRNNLPEE